ncbi:hypothetical protein SAY86_016262 [Trapa natans]|uniref:pectinesterase n=1 Tax=Trapa natans TaxID=22666 RepID=A0AAN7LBY8_TRANT|nr:hypothetical protein SAY86_016262 [Trapa natans]
MASTIFSFLSLIFFSFTLFFLLSISSISCSSSLSGNSLRPLDPGRTKSHNGFEQWLAWNVEKHRRRSALKQEELTGAQRPAANATWGTLLDWKLRYAEANKIEVTVSQDGTGDYSSINEALDGIPIFNRRRVIISIKPGVYREKISISRALPFVTFQGDPLDPPTITGNDTASVAGRGGLPLRTYQSATVAVNAHYFIAVNIRFENCYLNSVAKKAASVTAQKRTASSMASGFSFKNNVVTGTGQIYLGRAWGDYSRVVFSYTFLDKLVNPQGWSDWGKPKRDSRVYYGEYKCSGPGANMTGRVTWARVLSDEEAKPFIGTHYVDGESWLLI